MRHRFRILPARGALLVSTDLHGNFADFTRLRAIFQAEHARAPGEVHWVQLGDLVHAPSDEARRAQPELYDFDDGSAEIVEGFAALRRAHPENVHLVLGNHDHGHVGGPHTSKFHPDEVAHLERSMTEPQLAVMRALFGEALLAVAAPCGALLSHGSPGAAIRDLRDLDAIPFEPERCDAYQREVLRSVLTSYGQRGEETAKVLALGEALGLRLTMVIHGHDRDASGWFTDGGNQAQPVIFGAPREAKRFLKLDLAARYPGIHALREGAEIRRLYAP